MCGQRRLGGVNPALPWAALVVAAVVANVVAWWDWVGGWWTPGWGNLFTVAVALIAVGVGAWINLRNLNRAREDGRNDKLRGEVAGLLTAAGRWEAQWHAVTNRALGLDGTVEPGSLNYLIPLKAAYNETVAALYSEVQGRVFAIRMLTTDPEIVAPAVDIGDLLGAQVADDERTYWWAQQFGPSLKQDQLSPEQQEAFIAEVQQLQQRRSELPSRLQAATSKLITNGISMFAATGPRR